MMCRECGLPTIKAQRYMCMRCYKRLYKRGMHTIHPNMPIHGRKPHDAADCSTCCEVAELHDLGFTAADIIAALGSTADAVDIHLRRFAPHLRPIVAREANRARARRKATA